MIIIKIAEAFQEGMRECCFEVTMAQFGKHDFKKDPVYFDDYDLICLGSPVLAALPHQRIIKALSLGSDAAPGEQPVFERHMAETMEKIAQGNAPDIGDMDPMTIFADPPPPTRKGVVFATYSGYMYGPGEALATLELERVFLELKKCSVIGEYCATGAEVFHNAVDTVSFILGIGVNQGSQALQDYKDDPNAPQFEELTPSQREVLDRCANDKTHWPFETMKPVEKFGEKPGSVFWHYDQMNRPNERDLIKAKTFMLDLCEDYFLTVTGKPRRSGSVYISHS
jgi:hypothetical protein